MDRRVVVPKPPAGVVRTRLCPQSPETLLSHPGVTAGVLVGRQFVSEHVDTWLRTGSVTPSWEPLWILPWQEDDCPSTGCP